MNRLFLPASNHAGKYPMVDVCKEISSIEIISIHSVMLVMRRDTYTLDVGSSITADRPVEEEKKKTPGRKKVQFRKTLFKMHRIRWGKR
jgi:hypothetical protein